ncbi:uncharacterized protein EI90DRAFT_3016832 [Cantharellus anzutake]|uniref:uncharacterized protein n=1 Tax=Cantharellus anzutake TaxID=1750568 RepID=UPI0019032E1E|nr:uncharacterized protein EI90DRAFT_3016832 [Cantharellus anzutake]KAF8330407.1 hypothetical protein EI90DRAFT_3016832 [Cantharellus anzutake]
MNPFMVKIPTLPHFYTSGPTGNIGYSPQARFSSNKAHSDASPSIPSRGCPKCKVMEDEDSPVKKICENSRGAAAATGQQVESTRGTLEPLSPSKRLNREVHTRKQNPPDPVMWEPMASSCSQTLAGQSNTQPSTFRCSMCHNSTVEQIYPKNDRLRLKPPAIVELVLSILKSQNFTLSEFLVILFSNPIEFSASAKEMLKWFIGGRTVKNHPVDVVHALYNHPWAWPQQSYEPPYDTLPEYAIPTMFSQPNTQMDSKNTYSDLQHYFIA